MRPEAYFEKEATNISTDFLEDVVAMVGRELSPEEKIALGVNNDSVDLTEEDVDIIERA